MVQEDKPALKLLALTENERAKRLVFCKELDRAKSYFTV
jgi:hypothetical protein